MERRVLDEAIGRHLFELLTVHKPRSIAAYWPFDGEPDLLPTLHRFEEMNLRVALPLIGGSQARPCMTFRQWSPGTDMNCNHFGIPEPARTPLVPIENFDMILMPLLAWDEAGTRLGMGGGYYDRALQSFRNKSQPLRVGIAYEFQKITRLPKEPWDIPLHMVISEAGCYDTQVSPIGGEPSEFSKPSN
jgi:5-formyltetrahydrofolate cyclo-ligase